VIISILLIIFIKESYIIEIPELSSKPGILNLKNNVIIKEGYLIKRFLEVSPRDSAKPEVRTLVYIGKYKENLYFLFICKEKEEIRYQILKRDEFRIDNDWVMINIDPDNSGTRSYTFAMNPAGSLYDDLTVSGNTIPYYDFKWSGFTSISDTQWVAFFVIPISTFSNIDPENFRFLLMRIRVSKDICTYQWPPLPFSSTTDPYGTGVLEKYSEFFSLSILPYLTALNTTLFYFPNTQLRTGLIGKIIYKDNLKVLLGISPDFSTVETDRPQITLNNPYVLFYPEKRPIFIEGGDIFERGNIIYTRRINNPFLILKTFGKFKKTEFGFISTYDISNSYLVITPYESYEEIGYDSSFINILVFRRYFGKGNYIGSVINTRNTTSKNSNFVGFLEGGLDIKKHFIFKSIYGHSIYSQKGVKERGDLYKFKFSAIFHNFIPYFSYFGVSPTYNNQNGFLKKNDFSKITSGIQWRFSLNEFIFNFIESEISYTLNSNFIRSYRDDSISISFHFSLKQRTQILTYFSYFSQNFYGFDVKNLNMFTFFLISSPFDFYSLNLFISNGTGINYLSFPPEKSNIFYFGIKNEISFFKKILLAFEFKKYTVKNLLSQNVYFVKLFYALSNFISIRLIYTYNGETHEIYPLFTYQVTPYDLFFVGANLQSFDKERLKDWDKAIFIKFQKEFNIF